MTGKKWKRKNTALRKLTEITELRSEIRRLQHSEPTSGGGDMDAMSLLRHAAKADESEFTPGARGGYKAFDNMAVELEVAEFLHALVRLEKPQYVIESGAGKGYSTLAIADALKMNQRGFLWSFEPRSDFRAIAAGKVQGNLQVKLLEGDSRCWSVPKTGVCPDFVFLDSGPETRVAEIDYWINKPVTLVIHDAWRYALKYELGDTGIMFSNPRGLWVRVRKET